MEFNGTQQGIHMSSTCPCERWFVSPRSERMEMLGKQTYRSFPQESVPWPAVIVMQDTSARYQAEFEEKQKWTCYVGQRSDNAPICSCLSVAELSKPAEPTGGSCDCSDYYTQQVQTNFIGPDRKRFISFLPPPNFVVGNVQTFLIYI